MKTQRRIPKETSRDVFYLSHNEFYVPKTINKKLIRRNSATKMKVADDIRSRLLQSANSMKSAQSSKTMKSVNSNHNFKASTSNLYIEDSTQPLNTDPNIILVDSYEDNDYYRRNSNYNYQTQETYQTYQTNTSSSNERKNKEKLKRPLTAHEIEVNLVKEKRKIKAPDFKKTISREQLENILDSKKSVIPFTIPNFDSINPSND